MSKVTTWKRIRHAAKNLLDSVGRAGDAETIGKWLGGRIKWVVTAAAIAWTWIVANPGLALLVGIGILTFVGLFGETLAHLLTERRLLERKRKRAQVTAPVPSPKPPQPRAPSPTLVGEVGECTRTEAIRVLEQTPLVGLLKVQRERQKLLSGQMFRKQTTDAEMRRIAARKAMQDFDDQHPQRAASGRYSRSELKRWGEQQAYRES